MRKIKHDVQLTEFEHALEDRMNTYRDAIGDNDVTIEEVKERAAYMLSLINPKSAWSEEDEKTIKRIDSLLYAINESDFEDIHAWLKSLKDRTLQQPKQKWSEEDENAIQVLKGIVKHSNEINEKIYTMPLKEKLYDWLKSIKDRVQPQPKQEWNKEDEDILNTIINYFEIDLECTENDDIIRWLKSLKPQNRWKPSDEQMKLLKELVEDNNQRHFYALLKSLYEQLKKLKEE